MMLFGPGKKQALWHGTSAKTKKVDRRLLRRKAKELILSMYRDHLEGKNEFRK